MMNLGVGGILVREEQPDVTADKECLNLIRMTKIFQK